MLEDLEDGLLTITTNSKLHSLSLSQRFVQPCKKCSCFASFISAHLISRKLDESLTAGMIADDSPRALRQPGQLEPLLALMSSDGNNLSRPIKLKPRDNR